MKILKFFNINFLNIYIDSKCYLKSSNVHRLKGYLIQIYKPILISFNLIFLKNILFLFLKRLNSCPFRLYFIFFFSYSVKSRFLYFQFSLILVERIFLQIIEQIKAVTDFLIVKIISHIAYSYQKLIFIQSII